MLNVLRNLPLGLVTRHAYITTEHEGVTYGCVLFSVSGVFETTVFRNLHHRTLPDARKHTAHDYKSLIQTLSRYGELRIEDACTNT